MKFKNHILVLLILISSLLTGCIFQDRNDDSNGGSSTSSNGNGGQSKDGYMGQIIKTPDGSQFDDYLQTEDGEYGIESLIEPIQSKLVELRDSGKEVIIWGEFVADIPDYGGLQILVSKIEVPVDDFSIAWDIEKNSDLDVSFQYPEHTVFQFSDNSIDFDGWALEFFKNPKSLEFQEWLDSNFSESSSTPCQLSATADGFTIGGYETYRVLIGEGDISEELGIFAISIDKQNIVQLLLTEFPNQNYKKIIETFRFTKILTQDEVDINETKKNGGSNEEAGLANPAAVYCEEQAGKIEIRVEENTGGQYGICVFEDESECEEWAFYRGECKIGDNK